MIRFLTLGLVLAVGWAVPAGAVALVETPSLEASVADGTLPPVAERVPDNPLVVDFEALGKELGQPGGQIEWLARRSRDIRIMNVYGYARLVGYDTDFNIQPDLLESYEVEEERIFTFHLRPGLRWSDGAPFTAEDFRYYWEDVALNDDLKPYGPDYRLIVDGQLPTFEVLDDYTVRYTWPTPNPAFLPALAGAAPLYVYAPAHYLKQFHAAYTDIEELEAMAEAEGQRNWAALHIIKGDLYDAENPDLPVLQPWVNTTPSPAQRYVFERNPYFHRIDPAGHQLPYLDRVIVNITESSLIPAKTGAGESDLQARGLRFDNITFLKEAEERGDYTVRLWPTSLGSEIALYPNLNAADPVWRELNRDARFRRALSLAVNREELNQVLWFGLARPGNNTVLPESPFFDEERFHLWATYDIDRANALLDEIGLTERNDEGLRLLPDGRPLEIVIESTGERSIEIDALELIADSWRKIGVGLFVNQSQRDVWRNRIFAGEAVMSVWTGLDNGLITRSTVPVELAPVDQNWLQYPAWGQHYQTDGVAGTAPDLEWAEELMRLYDEWRTATEIERRVEIVDRMLDIHAEQVTSIGTVQGVLQPVVVSNSLHNVPVEAIYSWDPGAHFGIYRPETFWVDP
ncbi:ABC transporter substrate-binding protein [Inquilinus sp. CAU 1745]|uniref:ABC transporter substrate-binding protein n=1 Tax=Inquilinus sp. CAU 1745 TaxID=3140369 RepID=UPI00325ABF05